MTRSRPVLLALLPLLLVTARNKGTPLPGGYAIFVAGGDDIMLVDEKGVGVAGAKLARIASSGALVFGEIQALPGRPADSNTPGFFILDSASGTIERGLTREDWQKQWQKAGLQGEPELIYPERKAPRYQYKGERTVRIHSACAITSVAGRRLYFPSVLPVICLGGH